MKRYVAVSLTEELTKNKLARLKDGPHQCPECAKKYLRHKMRYLHVYRKHLRKEPIRDYSISGAACWCGNWMVGPYAFQEHCLANGGLEMHYHACLLGVEINEP